jgi:hypothetical protein
MGAPRGNRKAATGGRHGHGGRFNAKYLRALVIARRARMGRSVSSIGCAACRELNKDPTYQARLREWQDQVATGVGDPKKPPTSTVRAHKPHAKNCGHVHLRAPKVLFIGTYARTCTHPFMHASLHTSHGHAYMYTDTQFTLSVSLYFQAHM